MVQLAPHLVYPTPFLVPTLGDDRRDLPLGIGLNMYDVMATSRVGRSRRDAPGARAHRGNYWAPDRHRTIPGEEVARADPGARRARAEVRLPLLRLPDRRRAPGADDPRRGRALRRGVANGAEVTGLLDDGRAGPTGSPCREAESGDELEVAADNVVNATGVWADRIRPDEIARRGGGPADQPQPRDARHAAARRSCRSSHAACIVPAGEGRTIFALPWYGRALIGTTDNDYDGDIAHVGPAGDDIDYLLDAVNAYFETGPRPRRPDRRLRRGAAADLDRRPAEVGGHLAQGRALRDLVGDADDHRRQADDLAADGEAGRRPARRARGPRGAVPDRRHPARDGGRRGRPRPARRARRGRPSRRAPASSSRSATATPRATCSRSPASAPSWPSRSSRAGPTCWPRWSIAARLEQARSVADVLLRRTRLGILAAPQLRDADVGRAGRRGDGGGARLEQGAGSSAEAEAWVEAVAGRGASIRRLPRNLQSPTMP